MKSLPKNPPWSRTMSSLKPCTSCASKDNGKRSCIVSKSIIYTCLGIVSELQPVQMVSLEDDATWEPSHSILDINDVWSQSDWYVVFRVAKMNAAGSRANLRHLSQTLIWRERKFKKTTEPNLQHFGADSSRPCVWSLPNYLLTCSAEIGSDCWLWIRVFLSKNWFS